MAFQIEQGFPIVAVEFVGLRARCVGERAGYAEAVSLCDEAIQPDCLACCDSRTPPGSLGGSASSRNEDENKGMGDGSNLSEWHTKGEQTRVDFLQTDLALCFTFADLAQTELALGDREAAPQVLAKAEHGYATVARFLPEVEDLERRKEIERKWNDLRAALDSVHSQLPGSCPAQE